MQLVTSLLMVGLPIAGAEALYYIDEQYRAAVHEAHDAASGIAARAEAFTTEVFGNAVGELRELAGFYVGEQLKGAADPDPIAGVMAAELREIPTIEALALVSPQRQPLAVAGGDIALLVGQAPVASGTARFVGKPYTTSDGQAVEPIGMRVTGTDGKTVAFLMAAVKTATIAKLYATLPLRPHGAIALDSSEGTRIVGYGAGDAAMPNGTPGASQTEQMTGAESLFAIPARGLLQDDTVAAHIDGLPLVEAVTLNGRDFLGDWISKSKVALALVALVMVLLVVWLLISQRQITEAHENEIALRQAKADADEANAAKSRFLAHMSHEFRTPLNAIMGFADIIKNKVMGQEVAPIYTTYADHIHRSGAHLLGIVNDILDMAKIESGTETLQRHAVEITAVVRSAMSFVEGVAAQFGVKLVSEIAPGMPALNGDERFVRQVLINLLTNAIKFSRPEGVVTIRAEMVRAGALEITVIDGGPGIDPAIVRRIGEPFLQGDPALSRVGRGTGLGLSICKHYMGLLGGELGIASAAGHGTTAIMRFPAEVLLRRSEAA